MPGAVGSSKSGEALLGQVRRCYSSKAKTARTVGMGVGPAQLGMIDQPLS